MVITTIQEPEVTEAGIAAVMSRLQAYSACMAGLMDSLPPGAANGNDGVGHGGVGLGSVGGSGI